jgi:hypothetical protein
MALIPGTRYPAQTDADADYPHGKARNAGSYQDGTGTPLEKDWLNDDWGFKQALLAAASITPSGDPDKVGASQYLDALLALASLKFAFYSWSAASINAAVPVALTLVQERGGFVLDSGTTVQAPSVGRYLAFANGFVQSNSASNPVDLSLSFHDPSGAFFATTAGTRFSANALSKINLTLLAPWSVDAVGDPDDYLRLVTFGGTGAQQTGAGYLFILKL